eukprot:9970285-Prorocentrum_lima.AAC.1
MAPPPLPAYMNQTQTNHGSGLAGFSATKGSTEQAQLNCVQGFVSGGLDVGSMVLGATEDDTPTTCYFVSSMSASIPSAPPPPTSTEPIKK